METGQLIALLNIKTGIKTIAKVTKVTPCFVTARLLPPSSSLVKINLKTGVGTGANFCYMLVK